MYKEKKQLTAIVIVFIPGMICKAIGRFNFSCVFFLFYCIQDLDLFETKKTDFCTMDFQFNKITLTLFFEVLVVPRFFWDILVQCLLACRV